MCTLHDAGARAREWILPQEIFSRFTLNVRVVNEQGVIALPAPVQLAGGGMLHGLSLPRREYSLLPTRLEARLRQATPPVCSPPPPELAAIYHAPKCGDVDTTLTVDMGQCESSQGA